ncbi:MULTISPECIES: heavy metal translocating P-type ATPase [unclassified Corynebacterium]|uniref:heavy metal translocating P-type ATPase n=1 Tax=Corynebacterium TaxID=1716 RepID=UPI0025519E8E|nr:MULTISPECIES: heavy metal translocating P-type ATPase [unclassified Corynebacterium]MDK8453588.1 heavy metal translocating P-type ATPase [Corynebacterium sp. MSK084]MDK8468052.1 heavy metal translocating P-type ATPase [Corynebacterium sp. MSK130]MDK8476375.1 heavy metal translocating P-type ATPase [Corynebacterium sp. MSK310]MDK8491715.1 heavy metal translocating P-type ATPase [Corynebacterium sp. MSK175]MDK8515518.1 heavy metal translocating P-type ATPase [Corynebacterium sp. MSK123]
MSTSHQHGEHSGAHQAAEADHTQHTDHGGHEEHSHGDHHGHGHGHEHGHGHGHGEHAAMFRSRFWWSLLLSVPVVIFSPMVAELLGYGVPEFTGSSWIPPVLGTIIFIYGGTPFLQGGWSELKSRQPGMMLLIAMAITVAFVASWVTTLGIGGFDLDFWWELALLVVIMLLGHWLEMRALGAASSALDALAELLPDEAEKIIDGQTHTVPVSELAVDDIVLVRAGARAPADGTIVEGSAEFDESMITGESRPVFRDKGERVVAGTVATDNTVRVQVEAIGGDTALGGIQSMVAEAQESSSRAQALADRAAALLFWFALSAAFITAVVWSIIGSPSDAVVRTVTVLVIACPHALGLAIPLVIAISTEQAAQSGVLIKERMALERMRTIDAVLFDKTGTLTEGAHAVTGVATVEGISEGQLLAVAAAAEADSEHPLARAIVKAAEDHAEASQEQLHSSDFSAAAGRGIQATVDGAEVLVGGPNMLRELELATPGVFDAQVEEWSQRGAGVLHVVRDGQIIGALAVEDKIRPESRAAVQALQEQGVKVAMITGDATQVAEAVGEELGIDEVFAEVLPQDKDSKVTELQERGLAVAMVGDGVNDAPALARAEVGIAIGAGTDVAMESAEVVLASDDPRSVLSMMSLSRASYRKMIQNLIWASGYNIIAVPLAAGVLAPIGVVLSPAAGAVLMSLSTIVVAFNAQLLRRIELDPARLAPTSH